MAHIRQKFTQDINKITENLVESAKKTKLGKSVIQKHANAKGTTKLNQG